MKKILMLTMFALLALSGVVNAQDYRKWNFTNWSSQTIADLQEEAAKGITGNNWSDIEAANGSTPGNGVCFWSYADNVSERGYLMANGRVIAETEGLVWNTAYTIKRNLAIAVDYPSTSIGTYAGPQYLWLGGGKSGGW